MQKYFNLKSMNQLKGDISVLLHHLMYCIRMNELKIMCGPYVSYLVLVIRSDMMIQYKKPCVGKICVL